MKRTHYLASIVALLAGVYGLASCTAVHEDAPQGLFTEEVSFVVNLDEMPVTKTINNGNATVWGESDRISVLVHDISSDEEDYRSGYLTHRGNNEFGGRIGALTGDMFNWYFLYPYGSDNKSPKAVSISVESNPTQDGNGDNKMAHLAGEGFPLYGKVTNSPKNANIPAIYMVQVLSRFDYKVTNATSSPIVVKEIEFTAPTEICGDFTGNLTVDNPAWEAKSGASKVLKLTVDNGDEMAAGDVREFYAGFMPFKLEAGNPMQVKITAVNPSNPNSNLVYYKVYRMEDDVTFHASKFNTFNLSFDPSNSDTPISDEPVNPDPSGELEDQILTFNNANVTWTIGSGYTVGSSYPAQEIQGAKTEVTYVSGNTNVATINGSNITIVAAGQTTIYANAKASDKYKAASAEYTLTIVDQSTPQPTTPVYQKVTAEPTSWDGTYLIVDDNSSKAFAAFSSNASNYAVSVTINSDNTITSNSTVDQYAFTVTDAGVDHENSNFSGQRAYNLRNSEGMYIFGSSSEVQILSSNQKASSQSSSSMNTYYSVFKYSNGGVQVASAVQSSGSYRYYLGYSSGSFTYAGGSSVSSSDTDRRLQLYKLVNGSTSGKQIQNLSFSQSTVTWTLGSGYSINSSYDPQASGAKTTVSYTSSDTNVAVIENNKIVIKGAGTTTITANAVADATYEAASKSYTLIIREASSTPTGGDVYIKVTAEPDNWAGTYLFVDENSSKAFAAFSENASSYAVNVTISNGQIVANSDVNRYALTVIDAGVTHANVSGQEAYDIKNTNNKYVFYSSSEIQLLDTNQKTAGGGSSSSSLYTYHSALKYSNGGVQVISSGHSSGFSKYYLGYSDNVFTYSGGQSATSSDEARRVQLYKLVQGGGTTPTDPTKTDQNLSFANSTVTWTIGNGYSVGSSYAVQSVSGAQTTVTYTSSNTNVATVSGNNLLIVGAGTTIITANAVSNDQYNAASLSYTLNINQSGSTPTSDQRTYTYQSSVSAGTYLLGGYESSGSQYSVALFPTVLTGNWESSQGTVTNGQYLGQREVDSSNTLTFTDDSEIFNAEVELIASGSNWKIKVKSTGEYLVVPTADNRIVYTTSESSATAFSISGGSSYSSSSSNMGISSGSYYFYHSGSAHGFSMRAYQVTNIRLYKLTSQGSSSTQQSQPLSFNQSSVSISMNSYPAGSTYTGQAVNGAVGNVTYTSSNTNVAQVSGSGSNPTFTIMGAGTTTITANAAASGNYAATSLGYTLTVTSSSSTPVTGDATYVKASSLTVGGTYLITSVDDTKLFKGASDGSYVTINASNGVITDSSNSYSGYEFTITQSGSKYCIVFNDGKYLLCDYSSSGNSTTGLTFESSKPSDDYLYSYTVNNSVFEFKTAQRNSTSTEEVLYYKTSSMSGNGTDRFKIGSSGVGVGVHLYLKTSSGSSKKTQSLSFPSGSVSQAMETASGTMQVQTVQNAIGNVTYTSSNTNVATISGTTITIKGFGTTTITANAEGNDEYYAASATYTLIISRQSQEGVYNLENDCVYNYLNEALSTYTADNHNSTTLIKSNGGWSWGGGSSSSSGVYSFNGVNYTPSSSTRWDCPKPVTITWSTALSGNKDVYVYTDAAHTQPVNYIDQPITVSSSTNSVDVYNLIPEQAGNRLTYYYVVKSGSSEVASGEFTTEGRRRMMKINASFTSSTYTENRANNCRDFGGQVTVSGKHIKFGKMYRGSNMDSTDSDEQKVIKQYMKIGLDVDLRGSSERNNPLGFAQISTYDADTYQGHTQESYSGTSDLNNAQNMGATLKRVMNAVVNGVNVYIHCRVGADRTGYTCMMLEAILGVPLERCDMDYEMTSFSVVGTRVRTGDSVNYYHSGVTQINNMSGSTYQEKAVNYAVNTLGISRDLITQFQNTMLE